MTKARTTGLWWKFAAVFAAGSLFGALTVIQVVPPEQAGVTSVSDAGSKAGPSSLGGTGGPSVNQGGPTSTTNPLAVPQQFQNLKCAPGQNGGRSEEHTSELQSRFGISYAVFCLKKNRA